MFAPHPVLGAGVLGAGAVGSQIIRILQSSHEDFAARSGAKMEVHRVLVRNVDAPRDVPIDRELLTTDPAEVVDNMNLAVELIDGIEPARILMLRALNQDISVITGNKALLAAHGPELHKVAASNGVDLYYEVTVTGAVPIAYGLHESLTGDRIATVMGIVNNTANFILDTMSTKGLSYEDAFKQVQDLGSAEVDPTADTKGFDVVTKCPILAPLAFHTRVGIDDAAVEGISNITKGNMEEAARVGHIIKLLVIAERRIGEDGREGVAMRVHPAQVPSDHPLASANSAFNAILVEGGTTDRLMFYGQGVGGAPTVSAVLSGLIAVAHHRTSGGYASHESVYAHLPILDPGSTHTRHQIRLKVEDRPGILSDVAGILTRHGVSTQSVHQRNDEVSGARVITMTSHRAREADLYAVARTLSVSDAVRGVTSTTRVEGE